jgi:regulator of protease activity HflC (stomatin/prohibitin superfamily)
MINWLETVILIIRYLWPFRKVEQFQRGVIYVWARHHKHWPARKEDWTIGPGVWPVIPYFTEIRTASSVLGVVGTPLLQITASDGTPITFSAAMTWRIFDVARAWNETDHIGETSQELLAAVCSEKLAEVEADRLDPDRRKRLIASMREWLNKEMDFMGAEVTALRFTNFAVGKQTIRTLRIMTDTALLTNYK